MAEFTVRSDSVNVEQIMEQIRARIREKRGVDYTEQEIRDLAAVKPYDPGRPCEIRIEFTTPDRLVEYRNRRGIEQLDGLTLVSLADDWWTAWSQFFF